MGEIRHIGIIGSGKMGTSIFYYLEGFDFRLTWLFHAEEDMEKSRKIFLKKTNFLRQSGAISEAECDLKLERVAFTILSRDLHDCDLVIEAITEDEGMKKALFGSLDMAVNSHCIFTSNSSSIPPSRLVPSKGRGERFCGMHFFFPVALKTVAELITFSSTSSETEYSLIQFLKHINKTPFLQAEPDAFILNRLFLDMQAGAFQVFSEGRLSYREIDGLIRENLFPIGVFEFFDHVGIDVMLASVKAYTGDSPDQGFYAPLIGKLEDLVRLNQLGIKTKQGFYSYTPKHENAGDHSLVTGADEAYNRLVVRRLWEHYSHAVRQVLEKGLVSRDELANAIKDYTGMDTDPFLPPFSGSGTSA